MQPIVNHDLHVMLQQELTHPSATHDKWHGILLDWRALFVTKCKEIKLIQLTFWVCNEDEKFEGATAGVNSRLTLCNPGDHFLVLKFGKMLVPSNLSRTWPCILKFRFSKCCAHLVLPFMVMSKMYAFLKYLIVHNQIWIQKMLISHVLICDEVSHMVSRMKSGGKNT